MVPRGLPVRPLLARGIAQPRGWAGRVVQQNLSLSTIDVIVSVALDTTGILPMACCSPPPWPTWSPPPCVGRSACTGLVAAAMLLA
jgi:hypothetical protein